MLHPFWGSFVHTARSILAAFFYFSILICALILDHFWTQSPGPTLNHGHFLIWNLILHFFKFVVNWFLLQNLLNVGFPPRRPPNLKNLFSEHCWLELRICFDICTLASPTVRISPLSFFYKLTALICIDLCFDLNMILDSFSEMFVPFWYHLSSFDFVSILFDRW